MPNIIFISMDTTRYDHINTGDGARARTPALKRFAREACDFKKAFVTIPETLPSHLSIFTSHYPHELGVTQNHSRFDGRFKMIQETLKENGYTTYGITSLMSLVEPGFWKGFDEFNRSICSQEIEHLFVSAEKIFQESKKKLEELKNKKFFMFLHFSDPHFPYGPPTINQEMNIFMDGSRICQLNAYLGMILPKIKMKAGNHRFVFEMETVNPDFSGISIIELTPDAKMISKSDNIQYRKDLHSGCYLLSGQTGWITLECQPEQSIHLQILPQLNMTAARKMYRKEVEYMDQYIGFFLQEVKKLNLIDKSIIAIFSDHGEGLGERENYLGHVEFLNSQFIRVPLLLHIPGLKPRKIETAVSLNGLCSTILDVLHLPMNGFENSFLDLIDGKNESKKDIFAFTYYPNCKSNKISVIRWPFQGIYYWKKGWQSRELYDLQQSESFSPWNQITKKNLSPNQKDFFSFFIKESNRFKNKINTMKVDDRSMNRRKLENLKRLGYLH